MKQYTRQIRALKSLGKLMGKNINGAAAYRQLRAVEDVLSELHTDMCNVEVSPRRIAIEHGAAKSIVRQLFGSKFQENYFYLNSDPRGYALKIDDKFEREVLFPAGINLHRDMGGYGILAPEIE